MKKINRTTRKFALVTAGFAFFSVFFAALVMILFFKNLKSMDNEFAQISDTNPVIFSAEDETLPLPAENEENRTTNSTDGTNASKTQSYATRYPQYLESMGDSAQFEEFTLDGHLFYYVNTNMDFSLNQSENFLDFEDAARTALTTFQDYFPDNSWEFPFYVELARTDTSYLPEDPVGLLWYIFTIDENATENPAAFITLHPLTGDILQISCPHTDPVYNGTLYEGSDIPFLSLNDFINLTTESTWLSAGVKHIRRLDINEGESFIHYERDIGIDFTCNGIVLIPYTIGNGENSKKICLTLDLYTKDFVGYFLRTE